MGGGSKKGYRRGDSVLGPKCVLFIQQAQIFTMEIYTTIERKKKEKKVFKKRTKPNGAGLH